MIIFIPAKGESNRIPRKNLQFITEGYRLIDWSIKLWREMYPNAEIVVSTDDIHIKHQALWQRCTVISQPAECANGSVDIFEHFEQYVKAEKDRPIVLAQCTSPFTFKFEVEKALKDPRPIVRSGRVVALHTSSTELECSSNIKPTKHFTGNFVVVKGDIPESMNWTDDNLIMPVCQLSELDINDQEDLDMARWFADGRIAIKDLVQHACFGS